MALPLSTSSAATLPSLPPLRAFLPTAPRLLPSACPRPLPRAVSAGYAASFYSGSAAATGGAEDEEVGDEEGSASGFGSGLGLGGGGGGGLGMSAAEAALALEEREMPPCPPGLRQYETMVVLRPDMSEEERLALIQRYEEVGDFAAAAFCSCDSIHRKIPSVRSLFVPPSERNALLLLAAAMHCSSFVFSTTTMYC
jgi:small subunit ribosomal protein S6